MLRPKRWLTAHFRYLLALLARFRTTLLLASGLLFLVPLVFVSLYRGPAGERLRFGEALHHVYFLFFGQPTLPYVDSFVLETLNILVPPLGLAVIADGVVRFAYLFFAKHRNDKEWIEVISKLLEDHVVICGAGRVGFRVASQLTALGREVVVIEKREDAAFVNVLRDKNIPVLIDDVKSPHCLPRTNIEKASAIVCATDDDLANLNIALDARKENPGIRVVIRLFDDDLVAKVRDTFRAEAFSSSSLAAPALALAALDPRVVHSFQVAGHLMVVSEFVAKTGLPGLTVGSLHDDFRAAVLSIKRGGGPWEMHPRGEVKFGQGDTVTVQAEYADYLRLREFTGEKHAPVAVHGEKH